MISWWGQRNQNSSRSRFPLNAPRAGLIFVGLWACWGGIATAWELGPAQWLERHTQNFFFERRGSISPPDNIVILAIDNYSLSAAQRYRDDIQKQQFLQLIATWPWQRRSYAEALERLMVAGASTVSMDILFDLPSGYGEADDQQLKTTLQKYQGRVILAAAYLDSAGSQGAIAELFEPTPALSIPSSSVGLVNFPPLEVDGRVRRLGHIYREQVLRPLNKRPLPSLAEATLQAAQLPYPQPQGSDIFFYGPPQTFKQIPFWQVLDSEWWNFHLQQGTFKNKIVLIGPTAETAAFSDLHRTPFTDKMPGVELHANAIATLLEDKSIAPAIPNALLEGVFVCVGVGAAGVLLGKLGKQPVAQLGWGLGGAIAWGCFSYLIFTSHQLILPTAVPGMAIALSGLSYLMVGAISNQLEKLRLRHTLERYVAAPVAQEILKQPSNFQTLLKGQKLQAVILFSDIRGFTTLSYKLPPEQLVEQLNIYFNAMVEAIINAGGTLDKFIGDAVMAEFGFPRSQGKKNDAMNAIRAALEMRRALAQLREQFIKEGRLPLFNGIGLNFGEVIAGDIGSLRRSEYAVIGDAVNVASRVEGLTKQCGTDILITESLYKLVAEEVEVIYVGEHPLKGREDSLVRLYSLVGLKGEDKTLYHQIHQDLAPSAK
ncbi:MAG TPA: adenylate/guanylate cyclase domain-containing protein [Cyanobacteria bacterium UBA8803]|nr:adenylate/guanylate cyclase domain-containing protein [Cyanobacteria bacterium UBA9273]HBL61274.1 adenylate/guanylate cyclase domain-containing protein [Cyanobacteria bacterium UBA8803]